MHIELKCLLTLIYTVYNNWKPNLFFPFALFLSIPLSIYWFIHPSIELFSLRYMEIKLASNIPWAIIIFKRLMINGVNKCSEKISGAAYTCIRCELYRLHQSCAKALEHLPRKITHPLHSQHHLILDWSSTTREFTCDKCLKISSGTNYGCCRCDFELDLVCNFATNEFHIFIV